MKTIIDIQNFSFAIGNKTILDSLSLSVRDGEYLSIIGPNGAGKSTLLKCLISLYSGGSGSIHLAEKPLAAYNRKDLAKLVSYVPQSDGRSLPFSVYEFLMMGRYPHLSPFTTIASEDRDAVHKALELTETLHLAERYIDTLSGGERQIVGIAAALAQGSRIMLLDEPTTFLDPKHESDVNAVISKINRERGITVVSVTHDINSAVLYSDRIAIIKNGTIVFAGGAGDIMSNDILEDVYDKRFSFVKHPETGALIIVPEGTHA